MASPRLLRPLALALPLFFFLLFPPPVLGQQMTSDQGQLAPSTENPTAARDTTEADTIWAVPRTRVLWHSLLPDGSLLVSADSGLARYDGATGTVVWRYASAGEITPDRVEVYPWQPYLLVYPPAAPSVPGENQFSEALLLDLVDGRTLWTIEATGLTEIQGSFIAPHLDGLLVYGTARETGRATVALIDLSTGRPRWVSHARDNRVPEPHPVGSNALVSRRTISKEQQPLWLPDSSFLELWSTAGLHRISAAGDTMWTADLRISQTPAFWRRYGPMVLSADSQAVYVPHRKELHKIALADGQRLWDAPALLPHGARKVVETHSGIVVSGGGGMGGLLQNKPISRFLTVLDPATGKSRWKKPVRHLFAADFIVRGDSVIHVGGNGSRFELASFDIASGSRRPIVKKKLKLEGYDLPHALAVSDSGCHVIGSLNIDHYRWDGTRSMHSYQKKPEASALEKIGMFTVSLMASVAISAAMPSVGMGGGYVYHPGVVVAFNAGPRWTAAQQGPQYVYRVTNVYGGNPGIRKDCGIVKVAKNSGEIVRRVALNTKSPDFEADPFGDRLFFFADEGGIVGYQF